MLKRDFRVYSNATPSASLLRRIEEPLELWFRPQVPSLNACLSLDHGLDAILEYFARYLPNSHLLTIHRQLWRLDENLVS